LFVVALCYGGVVFGQTAEGAGRVSDQNAAVIPDTEIVITNAETGVIRKAATNAEGYYSIIQTRISARSPPARLTPPGRSHRSSAHRGEAAVLMMTLNPACYADR
jgi:hypothetical protein